MLTEVIITGKSVEEALGKAYVELGKRADQCEFEVLEKPKRSLFGRLKSEAKVRVYLKSAKKEEAVAEKPAKPAKAPKFQKAEKAPKKADVKETVSAGNEKLTAATTYLKEVLAAMGIENVTIKTEEKEDAAVLTLEGEDLGILIGRHGETLDALQYLTSLVCNRVEGSYYRITLDCGNYREKREETLKELAKKISAKVKRTGRSQILEPMNPYERRIIHAVLSEIEGVTSKSKGDEPNRRIVVIPTNKNKNYKGGKSSYHKKSQPAHQPERTMEQILKGEMSEAEKNTKLYSKIEL